MVYPDPSPHWRNVDRWPDTPGRQQAWEVFARLDKLDPTDLGAEWDDDGRAFLHFDAAAQNVFDDWRGGLEHQIRTGDDHPVIESHLSKYRSLVPSLALHCHLADGGHGPVGAAAASRVVAWAVYLESHARRVYSIVTNSATPAARALSKKLKAGQLNDPFTQREVYRKQWSGLSDRKQIEPALDLLIDLHWLREEVEETAGRSTSIT